MLYLHLFSFYSIFSGIFLNKDNLLAMLQVILKYLIDIFNRQKMVAQNIFLEILGRQVLRSQKKNAFLNKRYIYGKNDLSVC